MKSAYELAMSRLEKSTPSIALTETKKRELAEADSIANAKIAERKLLLDSELAKALGNPTEQQALQKQLASEIARIEEDREAKKEKIRSEK